jgi:poly(3-hydroxybutyrate) depolymerase
VETLLNVLERTLCVDRAQVRAHGESNGGMMIWQLLQSPVAERFASLVSVIGSPGLGTQLPPAAPVRFLGLWGARDRTIPARSADHQGVALSDDGFYYETAINATAKVATTYGCAGSEPWPTSAKGVTCVHFPGCTAPAEVVHCTFQGIHDWPYDATELIYRFYEHEPEEHVLSQKTPLLRRSSA